MGTTRWTCRAEAHGRYHVAHAKDSPMIPMHRTSRICTECGTGLARFHDTCWLCELARRDRNHPQDHADARFQYDLSTVLLTTLLIAACLGIARIVPSLAIALAILSGPAYIRTALVLGTITPGRPRPALERVRVFLESLALIVGLLTSATLALTSAAALFLSLGVSLAVALGVITAGIGECLLSIAVTVLGFVTGTALMAALLKRVWVEVDHPPSASESTAEHEIRFV